MEYKYYKFVGGRYFRVSLDEEKFWIINENNRWEKDTTIYFLYNDLGMDYEEVIDPIKLQELQSLSEESVIKK